MSPVAIRWLVLAIVVAVAAAGGWQAGSAHVYGKWLAEKGAQAAAAVKIVTRQGDFTVRQGNHGRIHQSGPRLAVLGLQGCRYPVSLFHRPHVISPG